MMNIVDKYVKDDTGLIVSGWKGERFGLERELRDCRNRCIELEERSKKAEDRCRVLELEVQKKNSEFELLEGELGALVVEKLAVEDELKVFKRRHAELEERITCSENGNRVVRTGEEVIERIVDLTEKDEDENVFQLMVENKVLDCEKKMAETEVEVWKKKFKLLESQVFVLEESLLSRDGEHALAGKLKREPELMGMKEMSEARVLKTKSSFAPVSTYPQIENKVMDINETTHAAASVISTRHNSIKGSGGVQAAEGTPSKQWIHVEGNKGGSSSGTELEYGSQVRKRLAFGEGSPRKKMAPSTPGGVRCDSVGLIDISDSDGEPESTLPTLENQGAKTVSVLNDFVIGGTVKKNESGSEIKFTKTFLGESDEEDMGGYKRSSLFVSTPKRKRASNIVTSDTESDDDDNVPICKLKAKIMPESNMDFHLNSCSVPAIVERNKVQESVNKRRLVSVRKFEENWLQKSPSTCSNLKTRETDCYPGIPTNEDSDDTEIEEDHSESEGESLNGFIVDNSDVSDSSDASGESENTSDGHMDYGDIMSKLQRTRDKKSKWEFEADLLAALGKDPELCMKAVCALYRQQTSEEKICKGTLYANQRGFSQCDAHRGTSLAEFLTDGDPKGDLRKSVKELQAYDCKGVELCRKLATHYSKQLFAIYQNKEDPFFHP